MKKPLKVLLVILCTVIVFSAAAQESSKANNDIRLGYGYYSASDLDIINRDAFGIVLRHIIFRDSLLSSKFLSSGIFMLQYQHQFNKVIHFGGVFTFNPLSTTLEFKNGTTETDSWFTYSLMPRMDFYYINKGIFSMYSGFAVGVSYFSCHSKFNDQADQTVTNVSWAYQINALGIRLGKKVGGFIELGFGYQGIVNLGISAKL